MPALIDACIGIDVGTSGTRLLLLDIKGNTIKRLIRPYFQVNNQKHQVWNKERRINLQVLWETIQSMLIRLNRNLENIRVHSLSVSSIGPSLVLVSEEGLPLDLAYTYAYTGAHDYVVKLNHDFQNKTGSMFSGALPYVQLLKIVEENKLDDCFKITSINDFLTWNFSNTSVNEIFSTLPNASYTGMYSLGREDWDWDLIDQLGIQRSILPKIIPLGSVLPLKQELEKMPLLRNSEIVAGTIDGIDAFWATEGRREDVIIGSASSTGALRRWRHNPKSTYHSRLIQCIHIDKQSWIELIPFNNVGTSFNWLATNFKGKFRNYITNIGQLNIKKLEEEGGNVFDPKNEDFNLDFISLPIFFPYIEGEPRGPQGRGKIKGGFVLKSFDDLEPINLYISLIIGISNMFRHNFDTIFLKNKIKELRLTGLIARKSPLFLAILATLINLDVVIMKKEQSVAWATAMRSLAKLNVINAVPKLETHDSVKPIQGEISNTLEDIYSQYLNIYKTPSKFDIIVSEKELEE